MLLNVMLSIIIVILLILSLIPFMTQTNLLTRKYSSPFECGFDPFQTNRMEFSLQFFLIAVIFLVFDVEITILLPLPVLLNKIPPTTFLPIFILIMVILIVGLIYEWTKGALSWAL
uniref:NADH-ubiquinone oxidoreductase chain 3 n=1 Tax=Narceus annularis TaxID=174156 RepID=Q8WA99_NARAN|nr:NADH dehydrogenase subunit 3 [Narceus annularus]AAL18208.1 NADH dehydrogenase subunit 3 [Narceus annularus]